MTDGQESGKEPGKETYGVEPGEHPPAPRSRPLVDVPLPPPASPVSPKGKIVAPELLSGFEEDADFDKDPELERVIMGKAVKPAEPVQPPDQPREDFVQPGLGNAKVWAIVGVVLLVAAMIATGAQGQISPGQRLLRVLLTLYGTLVHTGTGVVAVFVAARLLGKQLGNFELAAARMFAAVGAFALMISLQFSLSGVVWLDHLVVLILAAGSYVLLVASTFNLWNRDPLGYVIGSHFFLWLIVAVGMLLSQAIKPLPARGTSPTVVTPPETSTSPKPSLPKPVAKPATTPP
jgi:hypothetical protein